MSALSCYSWLSGLPFILETLMWRLSLAEYIRVAHAKPFHFGVVGVYASSLATHPRRRPVKPGLRRLANPHLTQCSLMGLLRPRAEHVFTCPEFYDDNFDDCWD